MNRLYRNIMALCESKGISGYRLCDEIGISKSILSDLKAGRKKGLSADVAIRIAGHLNVSVEHLYVGVGRDESPSEHFEPSVLYKNIASLCSINGVTASKMSEDLGMSKSFLTELKKGRAKSMNVETAQRIAKYFNVCIEALLGPELCDEGIGEPPAFDIVGLGLRIQETRQKKDITQQELAHRLGVGRSTISMWETGASQPDGGALSMLSIVLGVSTDFLLKGQDKASDLVGQRIRAVRRAKCLTQKKLASLSNVSEIAVRNYENATRVPRLEQLCLIADVLEVSVDYLLGRTEDRQLPAPTEDSSHFKTSFGASEDVLLRQRGETARFSDSKRHHSGIAAPFLRSGIFSDPLILVVRPAAPQRRQRRADRRRQQADRRSPPRSGRAALRGAKPRAPDPPVSNRGVEKLDTREAKNL